MNLEQPFCQPTYNTYYCCSGTHILILFTQSPVSPLQHREARRMITNDTKEKHEKGIQIISINVTKRNISLDATEAGNQLFF